MLIENEDNMTSCFESNHGSSSAYFWHTFINAKILYDPQMLTKNLRPPLASPSSFISVLLTLFTLCSQSASRKKWNKNKTAKRKQARRLTSFLITLYTFFCFNLHGISLSLFFFCIEETIRFSYENAKATEIKRFTVLLLLCFYSRFPSIWVGFFEKGNETQSNKLPDESRLTMLGKCFSSSFYCASRLSSKFREKLIGSKFVTSNWYSRKHSKNMHV